MNSRATVVIMFLVLINVIIFTSLFSYLYQIRVGESLVISGSPETASVGGTQ